MKTKSLLLCSLLAVSGAAFAQNAPLSGISETTDPDKIADIERRAQDLESHQRPATETGMGNTGMGLHRGKHHRHHGQHEQKAKETVADPKPGETPG